MVKYPEPKIKQTTNKWALIQCNKSWCNLTHTTIYPLQHSRHEFFYQTNPSKILVHLVGNSCGLNCALLPGLSSWLAAGSINSRCQDEWGFWEIMDSIGPPPARTFTAAQERSRGQSGTPGKLYSVPVAQNLSLVNFSGKILTFITLRERSS